MNVVDSSAWLEYFGDGPNAPEFAGAIESVDTLLVPTLTLFEVFKRTCVMASEAARLSLDSGLAMADSIILATALSARATLWTQDAHFDGMEGVEFRAKAGAAG